MKSIAMLFASAFIALSSATVQAQNYYVCDTGDDNNPGTSENGPFKTFDKALKTFKTMKGGDSVLFCRGGTFSATNNIKLFNKSCSKENVCTLSDYGNQSNPSPKVIAEGVVSPFWLNDGPKYTEDGGYVIKNIAILSGDSSKGVGILLANDVNDLTIENVHIQGFKLGVYSSAANNNNPNANRKNERIVLRKSTILDNSGQGWLGGCDYCIIENNIFENNGFGNAIFNHNIYVDSPVHEQSFRNTNITIRGNTLYKSANVNGVCRGTSLVVHGLIDNLVIDNNTVKEDKGAVSGNCFGISVGPGNELDESFKNVVIRNNNLMNVGFVGIGCSSCDGALIENNTILDESEVMGRGIQVPHKTEETVKSRNIKIRNNIVIMSKQGFGLSVGGENEYRVEGNKITIPEDSSPIYSDCIESTSANSETDVSSNSCLLHSSLSVVTETEETPVASSDSMGQSDSASNIEDIAYLKSLRASTTSSSASGHKNTSNSLSGNATNTTRSITTSIGNTATKVKSNINSGAGNFSPVLLNQKYQNVVTREDVLRNVSSNNRSLDAGTCRASAGGRCLFR